MYNRLILLLGFWPVADAALAADIPPTLFRNVTIVVLPEGRLDPRRDVLVRKGRIGRIGAGGRIAAPEGSNVVNGHGR